MIDTIKLKIPVEESVASLIRTKSDLILSVSGTERRIIAQKLPFNVPTWDRNIYFYLRNTNHLFLEFSLPKFLYNTNVLHFFPSQLTSTLSTIRSALADLSIPLPEVTSWEITRLDLCYNFRFLSQTTAEHALAYIKRITHDPRKSRNDYKTSIFFGGSAYSTKFYLKLPELYKHDYRALVKTHPFLAYNALRYADGLLRFEVSLHRNGITSYFGDTKYKLRVKDLDQDLVETMLNWYFKKLVKLENRCMSEVEVYGKLIKSGKKPLNALNLALYWIGYNRPEMRFLMAYENNRVTTWRKVNALRKAGIGFESSGIEVVDFDKDDFRIPSPSVVDNSEKQSLGLAFSWV